MAKDEEMMEHLDNLRLNNTMPISFKVVDLGPEDSATKWYGVVADYEWATRILFSGAYKKDAEAICEILSDVLHNWKVS